MTPQLTILDPVIVPLNTKTLFTRQGFTCSLLTLAPGEEALRGKANNIADLLLVVADGAAVVRLGDVHTILGKEQAFLIHQGQEHAIAAHGDGSAKILQIDVPPRPTVSPEITTFDR